MKIETLNRGDSQNAMNEWIERYPELPSISDEYIDIRKKIQSYNAEIRNEMNEKQIKGDYYLDYKLGLRLYMFLNDLPDFSVRVASNDDFWRYMSLKVVPDVVSQRWGRENESHFWSQPTRIWLRSLWWYVHESWQGDLESTEKLLSTKHFTTDTILNFEERSGRKGVHIEAYRSIIAMYGRVTEDQIRKFNRNKKKGSDDLFRVVMKLNTAKMIVIDPTLYPGGESAYAAALFKDAGVDIDEA